MVLDKRRYSITITNTITITITNIIQTGYSLDKANMLRIMSLEFQDSFSTLLLTNAKILSALDKYEQIKKLLATVDSSANKGFLISHDLQSFPIISELLPSFLQCETKAAVVAFTAGDKSMESYKWLYNFILLTLYLLCLESQNTIGISEELQTELTELEKEIYDRLDPSIRHHLVKRGIIIKQNTYIGFDTEFCKSSLDLNTLVSAQLAVTTKTYLQVPKIYDYSISMLDEKSHKIVKIKKDSSVFNYSKLETSIQMIIKQIRTIKYGNFDESMLILTESLRMVKGLKYYEDDDRTTFSFPSSVIQPYIHFGDSFSLKQLIAISASISKPIQEETSVKIMELIRNISSKDLTIIDGKENLIAKIYKIFGDYSFISHLSQDSGKQLSFLTEQDRLEKTDDEKRMTRAKVKDLFPQAVSFTKTKCYYLIAHFTPADLSILSDFDKVKDELTIVNGSFVTINNPITIDGRKVHVRDTMLLAPAGDKSLASLGKLYGSDFSKVGIKQTDLEDMQGFLTRDKDKFVDYALRDALISLIHACWMEDFNFNLGGLGIPLSLSAIGRKYVKSI